MTKVNKDIEIQNYISLAGFTFIWFITVYSREQAVKCRSVEKLSEEKIYLIGLAAIGNSCSPNS